MFALAGACLALLRQKYGGELMRTVFSVLAVMVISLGAGMAAENGSKGTTESFAVVRLMDFDRTVTFDVMSASDAADLQKRIAIEMREMDKALREATREWDATVANKKVPLPLKIAPRTLRVLNTHTDSKKADEALKRAEDRYKKEEEKIAKEEEAKSKKLTEAEKTRLDTLKTEQASALEMFKTKLDKLVIAEEAAEKERVQQKPKTTP